MSVPGDNDGVPGDDDGLDDLEAEIRTMVAAERARRRCGEGHYLQVLLKQARGRSLTARDRLILKKARRAGWE